MKKLISLIFLAALMHMANAHANGPYTGGGPFGGNAPAQVSGGSSTPSGPAGGDLGGTYPNPTVLNLSDVTTGSPTLSGLTVTGNASLGGATTATSLAVTSTFSANTYTHVLGAVTTYTFQASDMGLNVTTSNSLAITTTLPQAGTAGFTNGLGFSFENVGSGMATINCPTALCNGNSSLSFSQGQGGIFFSDATGAWDVNLGKSGAAFTPVLQPLSVTTTDTAGNEFPYTYFDSTTTGAAAIGAPSWGTAASLGADTSVRFRFKMPPTLPASGTLNLCTVCLSAATTGVVKYTVSDADIAVNNTQSVGATVLNSETQTSITWSAADNYVQTCTPLTEVAAADHISAGAVTFNHTSWTLAQILSCNFIEEWK